MPDFDLTINSLKDEMLKILDSGVYNIVEVEKNQDIHGIPGVYLIFRPDIDKIVYVGKTKTSTISKRMHQHLHMKESRDLQIMLKNHPDYPQDKTKYKVQYLEISDERKRFFFESFLVSILQPPFNG